MIGKLCAAALALLTAACATTEGGPSTNLSGIVQRGPAPAGAEGPTIGIVADSQLQTRGNYNRIQGYRGPLEDWAVKVSIRPPALDWAARSMLRTQLEALRERGADAIFYLGDGANNGCFDEFAAGFDPDGPSARPGEEGVLAILDEVRRNGIPVFFALGNHDFLGAGSTAFSDRRDDFCEERRENGPRNAVLSKFEAIRLIDAFNRGNARFPGWEYRSSFDEGATRQACGTDRDRQHVAWGCYLAARVDYRGSGPAIQFLLLDTNDWASVRESRVGRFDQAGLRGAMSFGSREGHPLQSQTRWFENNATEPVAMRIAVTHYDVRALRLRLPFVGWGSSRSQQFMNLFSTPGLPRRINQNGAFVISAHTHHGVHTEDQRTFRIRCEGLRTCGPDQYLTVADLNTGSTTDWSNYSTLVRLTPSATARGALYYDRVELDRGPCPAIYRELESFRFDRPLRGATSGWPAIGVDPLNPRHYNRLKWEELRGALWPNIESFVNGRNGERSGEERTLRANCIGLFAAAVEKGRLDPYTGRLRASPRHPLPRP